MSLVQVANDGEDSRKLVDHRAAACFRRVCRQNEPDLGSGKQGLDRPGVYTAPGQDGDCLADGAATRLVRVGMLPDPEPPDTLVIFGQVDQLEIVGEGTDQDPEVGRVSLLNHRFECGPGTDVARAELLRERAHLLLQRERLFPGKRLNHLAQ